MPIIKNKTEEKTKKNRNLQAALRKNLLRRKNLPSSSKIKEDNQFTKKL